MIRDRIGQPLTDYQRMPMPKDYESPGRALTTADPRTSYSTVWRLLNALVECGLAHREISPADGIFCYAPMKVDALTSAWRAKTAEPPSPRKKANMSM
jgi:hypothetical protein